MSAMRSPPTVQRSLRQSPTITFPQPIFPQTVSPITSAQRIPLPTPFPDSDTSIEQALAGRRSTRSFEEAPLTLREITQLLWAAQGITDAAGHRTAPSAGALYPLEFYLVAGRVEDLATGLYRYYPREHELLLVSPGDKRKSLSDAALSQESIEDAPATLVIAAVFERTTMKYRERGVQYVHNEAGAAAENVYLQAVSLNLGIVFVGAFEDSAVQEVLGLSHDERPLCMLPVGSIRL